MNMLHTFIEKDKLDFCKLCENPNPLVIDTLENNFNNIEWF